MLDRVREALFSTLGMRVQGARVLDLFAGTGSLGLETLSRGADSVRLVESDRTALKCLRANVETLGVGDRTEVLVGDALEPSSWQAEAPFDIVFFDPPYPLLGSPGTKQQLIGALRAILSEHLTPEGVLVFHTPRGGFQAAEIDAHIGHKLREYGSNSLWYFDPLATQAP